VNEGESINVLFIIFYRTNMKIGLWQSLGGVLIVLAFLCSVTIAPAATSANLVTNGDLETAGSSASVPQGWSTDSWGTLGAVFTYPIEGNASAKAAQVQITSRSSGDAKWMFDHVPVTVGTTYTYSDTYRSNVATEVDAEYKMSNGSYTYVWLGDTPATGSTWGTFSGSLKIPTGVVSVSVMHVIAAVGTLAIDNVVLGTGTSTPPPPPPPPAAPAISSFSANPISIVQGSSTLLSWSVSNASSTSISPNIGVVSGSSLSVSPTQTTTYVLTATNPNGSVAASTTVTVTAAPPPPPPPTPKPTITSFVATPSSIASGSSTVLSWVVSNASSTSINQGVGVVTGSSQTVSPTQTTTYTLTATNPGGSVSTTTVVTVTQAPPPPPPPPSSNLIPNGDLEQGSTNNPTGWNADYWGSLTANFTYPVAGNGGGKAAQLAVTNWQSGDAKWYFDHVAVSSHTIYQFSDDYISNVVDNVSVEIRMSNGTYQYQWVANAPATGGVWKHLTAEITVPTGAVSMTVLHTLDKNGSLTIDNANLVALPANPFPTGMVTLTFDDNLVSQYNNARPILNTSGIKATYGIITQGVRNVSGDTAAMTWAQITTLKNEGNEIASHTRTHADLTLLNTTQLTSELQGSMSDLVANGFAPKTFIYPLGAENPTTAAAVKNAGYIGARGSYWGLNSPTANRWAVYDVRFDRATMAAQIDTLIAEAIADKRWIIIELHDVKATGGDEYTITPGKLQTVANYIKSTGVKVVTLEQGLNLMQSQ
jgi:peptidoglycan/xylan/chitin deacetylase (PgdA/CDA1 family)